MAYLGQDDAELQQQDQPTSGGAGYDPYAKIRALYQQITGGQYTPKDSELSQWGSNIDDQYLGKIRSAIASWWPQYQAQQTAAPKAPETPTAATDGSTSGGPDPGSILPPNAPGLNDYFDKPFTPQPPVSVPGSPTPGTPYIPQTPTYTTPTFPNAPARPNAPAPFSYQEFQPGTFQAPTVEQAVNSPGYQFRVNQGRDQLEHSAAARGVLNSGGTLKGIEDYGQNSASQEYQNVWNREYTGFNANEGNRFNAYMANRSGALQTYNTNDGTQVTDPYQREYQAFTDTQLNPGMDAFRANVGATNTAYSTQASAGQHQTDMNYLNDWNLYNFDYNKQRNYQNDVWGRLYNYAQL